MKKQKKKHFTLVEILIVIGIKSSGSDCRVRSGDQFIQHGYEADSGRKRRTAGVD